jgi:hypothetical protein
MKRKSIDEWMRKDLIEKFQKATQITFDEYFQVLKFSMKQSWWRE